MPTAIVTEPDVWSRARQFLPRLESSTIEDKGNLLGSSAEVLRSLLEADEHSSSRLVEIINIQKARIATLQASLEGGRSETATLRQQPDGLIQELRSELTKSREEALSLREHMKRIRELKEEEERFGLDIIREMVAEMQGGSSHDIKADDCLLTARLFTRQRFLLVTALKVAHELREDNVKLSLQLSSVRSRLERLGGEAAIKALSSAVEARDRRIAEKDAKIAELGARLEAARREAIEQISNTSMASSTISERTNLEASDTEKALLVDTQETNLSMASSVPCREPIRQYDVDGNKEVSGIAGGAVKCMAVTESESSQSRVQAPQDGMTRGPRQAHHVRGMVPPPAPLLTGRDLEVTAATAAGDDVSMEAIEGAVTVRNSNTMPTEMKHGPRPAASTSESIPEPSIVGVCTPGRGSDISKLSLSATTFNGVKRRATTHVKLRNPRLDFAAAAAAAPVAPSTDTKLPNSRQPVASPFDAGLGSLPQSGDLLRAWHQNSGSLPGHESPGLWSPQQPQIVQRHFSANAYTAGGQRKLVLYTVATNAAIIHGQVARQLSGTPILTAEFPRQNTPDAYSSHSGMVRQPPAPPALSSHIPRPPQFINLGALSHRPAVASTTASSRQSSASQFAPLVGGSPVSIDQPSFLGISPGTGRVTPGSSGLRMVNNTPVPQLPLHKANNYTIGLPLWSGPNSGPRGQVPSVLGQGVMRTAR